MSFLWPNMLWLLLLVPVLILVYILIQRRKKKYALRYSSLSLIREALGRGPGFRRHIPQLLFIIALAIMMIALARPAATITLPSQEGTVILTFDTSGSMRAEDIKPSRIEAAKVAAKKFVEKQPSNVHIGVLSFSESATIVQAPTKDREAVLAAINRLTPQRRTAIGSGILTSLNAIFEEISPIPTPTQNDSIGNYQPIPTLSAVEPGSYTSAVIVLLSDGQSNTGPPPLDIIQQASDRGVRVYTVGLGSPEGTVLRTGGFSIRVRLDEDTLKQIAQRTNGQYLKAESETDLSNIYENLSKKLVFKAEQTEITAWFTGFAAILIVFAGILSMLWFQRLT
jgi:Ca-activated chloride channel homolog